MDGVRRGHEGTNGKGWGRDHNGDGTPREPVKSLRSGATREPGRRDGAKVTSYAIGGAQGTSRLRSRSTGEAEGGARSGT